MAVLVAEHCQTASSTNVLWCVQMALLNSSACDTFQRICWIQRASRSGEGDLTRESV